MLAGSIWMIALRWAIRLTGLVSTVILARLLNPSDFEIVAMAMLVVGMLEILNQTGQKLVLIRHASPGREDYDTAWTLSVLVGCAVGVFILALSPVASAYFHESRALPVMQCLAVRSVIAGFENIGVVDFRRDLRFDRFFSYNVYPKLIAFVVTVGLAFALRNYWALVAGILANQITAVAMSYTLHPYRPRFSLVKLREMHSFSGWTLFKQIGFYFNAQIDQAVIGGLLGAASMGRYAVAADLATSASQEINDPMVAVLFPVMATIRHNSEKLRDLYIKVLSWSAVVCASTSVGNQRGLARCHQAYFGY